MKPSELTLTLTSLLPKCKRSIYISGQPGSGKSSIVSQVAAALNLAVCDIRAVLLDPVDLRGIPTIKDNKTYWCPPAFLPTEGSGIVFLDEIAQANVAIQSSLLQLCLDRRIGESYVLPDAWHIVAASNRQEDRAGTHRLISNLRGRFITLTLETDFNDWKTWAYKNNMDQDIISFLNFKTVMLSTFDPANYDDKPYASPRSWHAVSDILTLTPAAVLPDVVAGCVGEGPALEFMGFRTIRQQLPDVEQILADPKRATIPKEAMVLYALLGTLVDKVRTTNKSKWERVATYFSRLPDEYAACGIIDAARVDKSFLDVGVIEKWILTPSHRDLII